MGVTNENSLQWVFLEQGVFLHGFQVDDFPNQ